MTICCVIGDTKSDEIILMKEVADTEKVFLQWKRAIEPAAMTVNDLDDT